MEIPGQERLLNVARDGEFLFHALALAFALHETRVVENACGLAAERIENLAVEVRKSSGAARVKIEGAEKTAAA